jgi:hypothetical protein
LQNAVRSTRHDPHRKERRRELCALAFRALDRSTPPTIEAVELALDYVQSLEEHPQDESQREAREAFIEALRAFDPAKHEALRAPRRQFEATWRSEEGEMIAPASLADTDDW